MISSTQCHHITTTPATQETINGCEAPKRAANIRELQIGATNVFLVVVIEVFQTVPRISKIDVKYHLSAVSSTSGEACRRAYLVVQSFHRHSGPAINMEVGTSACH